MNIQPPERFVIGPCFVRVHAEFVDLPESAGWMGVWAIYTSLPELDTEPVRIGSTDVLATIELAHATARSMATAIARSLR